MKQLDVFVSVGGTATDEQEDFVRAVEDRLRSERLIPHTVGRNTFSSDSPLKTVIELMERCSGTIVIALERMYFTEGVEKRRGPNEKGLSDIMLPTPWNQIEAAMAYVHGHPLMVITEEGLRKDGLLEHGYDWYVQSVKLHVSSLNSGEFNGVLSSWKTKVAQLESEKEQRRIDESPINHPFQGV